MAEIDAAEGGGYLMRVDPKQFTQLGMLHESRHVRQIERALAKGENALSSKWRNVFEVGAYEYELRLANRFGFSAESLGEIARRLSDYLIKARNKLAKSAKAQDMWR